MIRQDIIRGTLDPGQKLRIDNLCERYSVGATPIREALNVLTAEGLVDREDQLGFRVAAISVDEFEKLLSVRCLIELPAFRYAIETGGREWEEAVMLAHYRLSRVSRAQPDQEIEWERHHKAFHMSLLSACGSDILLRLCRQLYDENTRYRYAARMKADTRTNVTEEHKAIADAALARDADKALALLGDHYRLTGRLLRKALERRIADMDNAQGR
jgi:GntR family transcriptional regulator, carbon starvation induced regulator